MKDINKKVTMDYEEHERLLKEIDELKSHIHQCETDGKYKVITVTKYLTTTYVHTFGGSSLRWDDKVKSLMSLDELEAAKLESTERIVRDVAIREKELDDQGDKLKLKDKVIDSLMKSKELLDRVRELSFLDRINFVFYGVKDA